MILISTRLLETLLDQTIRFNASSLAINRLSFASFLLPLFFSLSLCLPLSISTDNITINSSKLTFVVTFRGQTYQRVSFFPFSFSNSVPDRESFTKYYQSFALSSSNYDLRRIKARSFRDPFTGHRHEISFHQIQSNNGSRKTLFTRRVQTKVRSANDRFFRH